jgi:ATP-dependent DNA helicase DinG
LRTGLTAGEPSKRLRGPLPVEDTLSTPLEELDTLLGETVETASSSEEEAAFRSLRGRAKDIRTGIRRFFSPPPEDHAAWVERAPGRRAGLRMRSVPVDVSEELKIRLFESFPTVVLTSATLAVAGSFATLRGRVGVDVAEEKLLDSPFDYPRRAALFLPETPDPKTDADAHERAVTERCVELADAVPGGIFVLFTSRAQMDRVHRALTARVTDRPIFKQGDAAPLALIAKFKAAENGMLLGTDTFWQGVDVPGKALRCVVIARLPFAVPTEPMEETRQEWLAKQGKNPFMADTVPRAVIKFRQGFGRLIRTHDDIGCVAVLDPRAETKSYGRTFLKSLPPCRRVKTVDALKLFFQDADGRDRA